ncbi:MAG TPA: cytochrome c biogenesis protein CcsA [Tepidisphaeraceae bacterium]|nr:cytochrome c biogenesis protein CcsA [Tepidisphaeraceae bacterium]
MLKRLLTPLASLKLTVALLVMAIVVIFAGTWAQIDQGIWQVQARYFHSFFTRIDFQLFLPRPGPGEKPVPGGIPMLGGMSIIILLLVNLLAAHTLRFKLAWKRSGVLLIHAGLILLLVGEIVTAALAVESRMTIAEGQTVQHSEDIREVELAVIDPSDEKTNSEAIVPQWRLAKGGKLEDARLPFTVEIDQFLPNSAALGPQQAGDRKDARATRGPGVGITVVGTPTARGVDGAVDLPSAYVTLSTQGRDLGTFLLTTALVFEPQPVDVDGKPFLVDLRFKRDYKPYSLTLIDFAFDRHTGTNIPKNFSSLVRLQDPTRNEDRQVKIWMNNPLRYAGETFYQSSFDNKTERTTILQVVRNPGWLMPYVSCVLVTLGMLVHFGILLVNFLRKRVAPRPDTLAAAGGRADDHATVPAGGRWAWLVPLGVTAVCALYLLSAARPPKYDGGYDLATFGRLPVLYEGRVMPLDSLARNSLRIISNKSAYSHEVDPRGLWERITSRLTGKATPEEYKSRPAIELLAQLMGQSMKPRDHKIFRIDHPQLLGLLKLDPDRKLFTFNELAEKIDLLIPQVQQASAIDSKRHDLFQKKVMELFGHMQLYQTLAGVEGLFLAPPVEAGQEWQQFGEAYRKGAEGGTPNPGVQWLVQAMNAYADAKPASFNGAAAGYVAELRTWLPRVQDRTDFEVLFNRYEPFIRAIGLYVVVFLLAVFSWLGFSRVLTRAAFWVLLLTLAFHSLALAGRVYISGRPPVTNLYSSAIFIAWGCGILAAGFELVYRNGLGSATAAVLGFLSLIVAHNLAGDGDTMKMLQAVLDTNFWLATHVVVITLGYSAMFLAGALAAAYLIRGVFTRGLHGDAAKAHYRMVYGVVCFAMLFSFVGTVLGGIWADQSWGRFWGWDPKENGAALIVLWVAVILHARWGGIIKERGFMAMAVFGNVVTSWSWFGTNMLGVGLHSYGFMDSAIFWMAAFIASQLVLMSLAFAPLSLWRSKPAQPAPQATRPGMHEGFPALG